MAWQRRNDNVERIRCARSMSRRIGQRLDDLQLLDDRSGPTVRDDDWQRLRVLRANVDEMNVHAINLGQELRQGV